MKNLSLFASALAVLGLTACEKMLVDDIEDVGNGQVKNSVLQVRTRSGGSSGDAATVAYPVTVYVFAGDECRAVQTIGDEGQTRTRTRRPDGGIGHGNARRWRHKHSYIGHDEEDDAHSGRDYQEDSDGGNGGERDDSAAVAVAHRRRYV